MTSPDTIFALASGAGKAGVAVIRISGPAALDALKSLAPSVIDQPAPRYAFVADLFESESNQKSDRVRIDQALILYFKAPNSFTGEDVVELHVHGGLAVIDAVLNALAALSACRPAGPGEFSRRAFENGKMDLTAVEAIADLVNAETSSQRHQALAQMQGGLFEIYEGWRERLVGAIAYAEASIDFAEEDIPDDLFQQAVTSLDALISEIQVHLDDKGIGERVRQGFRVALTGAPNVGKSSLLNALAARDAAIVSDIAGTTRDAIEVPMDLGGFAVTIIDTAGLRESDDVIEQEGVRRARSIAASADVSILLCDATVPLPKDSEGSCDILVVNKLDLAADIVIPTDGYGLSLKTGVGLNELIQVIAERVSKLADTHGRETPPLTRLRHRTALEKCLAALERARGGALAKHHFELVAEDMRIAGNALGEITGRVDVEELLDKIFRDFCIGK